MGKARWVIGWAMVGRAEFAYLIAQMASAANMLESRFIGAAAAFVVFWALVFGVRLVFEKNMLYLYPPKKHGGSPGLPLGLFFLFFF